LKPPIAITALASFSPLGNSPKGIWENYLIPNTLIVEKQLGTTSALVATIPEDLQTIVTDLRRSDNKYKSLDNSVLYAILASRQAVANAGWKDGDFGINLGSSRGATTLFEKHHEAFLATGKTPTLASPSTTLGNISSWVAHDLKSQGPEISHSITCSTALHAVLNGVAWLRAGMADKFLVGGSEAPLTEFTIAQMKALKIYANPSETPEEFPCKAFDLTKTRNSMVLGEGASVACLELGKKENALAYIEGIGYATETLQHSISITDEADCFQKSMRMALADTNYEDVDVVVMHAPGTLKGDSSEYKAVQKVFGTSSSATQVNLPMLTTNKWKIGHTFGASGMLNIEMGIMMMQHNTFIGVPYIANHIRVLNPERPIRKVLVNAVGFGGNAVSVLLSL
jgi:3-oxoacyl-(acyl-carrier-protein) synthase